jgi:two-component system, NarL family, sensor kinase
MQERSQIILYISITTLLILLLAGAIIFVAYLYQSKRLLYEKTYTALQLQHEKNIASTQLEVQENIFRHISQEIHDNIGLNLSIAKLHLISLSSDCNGNSSKINTSIDLVGKSLTQLKNISQSLNSDIINSCGLIKAIEHEIQKVRETISSKMEFEIKGEPIFLDSQKELMIFRIIQESLNNIVKHACATQSRISLNFEETNLILTISDNGGGFSHSSLSKHSAEGKAGLKNMESRSKMIKGEMQIDTNPGKGTTLQFIIPI